jgi:hypothetical protein
MGETRDKETERKERIRSKFREIRPKLLEKKIINK